MIDKEILEKLKSNLENAVCVGAENTDGFLQLLFDNQRLIIQSGWRLRLNDVVDISDESTDIEQRRVIKFLDGNTVETILTKGECNDLVIRFSNDLTLESFPDSQDYEHWNYVGESPRMIVAGPGKLWSSF